MIKNLVFHIGDPKCGSTAIQAAMRKNACVPEKTTLVSQPETNASVLANVIAKGNQQRIKRLLNAKRAWCESNTADVGIISAEFFERVAPAQFDAALKEHLPEYSQDVRAIAYVRSHSGRLISGYAQRIKTGAFTGNLDEFTGIMCGGTLLQYHPRFLGWKKLLQERFTLRPFMYGELKSNDIVDDFFSHLLGGERYKLESVEPSNESLSLEELSGLLIVQEGLIQGGVPKHLRLPLGAAVARQLSGKSNRLWTKLRLDKRNAEKMYARFKDDARALDAEFFQRPLMESELLRAIETSIETPQSLNASQFFSDRKIKKLREASERISQFSAEDMKSWHKEYQVETGQLSGERPKKATFKRLMAPERQVWKAVDEIVSHLLP
ncbi:hypothetical protein [Donghicola sp. XS_ASV15]|uniref:hypothetical protein n=1 Tax=Donghicola sp. XS_ASV15 TaxID=3241295 RepID=UPI0035126434